jgi:hypothetical protein
VADGIHPDQIRLVQLSILRQTSIARVAGNSVTRHNGENTTVVDRKKKVQANIDDKDMARRGVHGLRLAQRRGQGSRRQPAIDRVRSRDGGNDSLC